MLSSSSLALIYKAYAVATVTGPFVSATSSLPLLYAASTFNDLTNSRASLGL